VKRAIICLDDEKIVLDSLKRELRTFLDDNFIIEVAERGSEGLELVEELTESGYDIPVIISDYVMPEMKGDEFLSIVKKANPKCQTIMLTGQATITGVTNAINSANLYRYISKPWDEEDMQLTIKEAINSYDKDREIERHLCSLEIANEKLLKLDSAKTYFLGLLAHELKTPLIGIYGNAKLIEELTEDEDLIEAAGEILCSEARLRKFSELSLLITRIQMNKYVINFYQEPLWSILEISLFNNKKLIEDKQIKIIQEPIPAEFYVNIDTSLISKVFDIIIDNAIKYSAEKGELNIKANVDGDLCSIKIIDFGKGFEQEDRDYLFDSFASSKDLLTHSEGTGLSMAATKVIMDLHGYKIKAYNCKNAGACVELIFTKSEVDL